MKILAIPYLVTLLACTACSREGQAVNDDSFCKSVVDFVESVKPDEQRVVTFRSVWGSNFTDDAKPSMGAKRCSHGEHAPGMRLCSSLLETASMERPGDNVERVMACLTGGSEPLGGFTINGGSFSLNFGMRERGSEVEITLADDPRFGGMLFRLSATGY